MLERYMKRTCTYLKMDGLDHAALRVRPER